MLSRKRRTRKRRGDDFYRNINGAWLKSARIPPTETRITQAYFIHTEIKKELATIIRKQKTGLIADMLASWGIAETQGIPHGLGPLLQLMFSMQSPSDISTRIGLMNRHGLSCPMSISILGDPRDNSRCRVHIDEGSPNIGIPEYWLWPNFSHIRRAYRTYINTLATVLSLPQLNEAAHAEKEFSDIYPSAIERKTRINMLNWKELNTSYPHFDWAALLTTYGIPADRLPTLLYNVPSHAFLHRLHRRLVSWPIKVWQAWFALIVAQWVAGMSPHGPLRSAWFAYSRRFLQGMERDDDPEELRMGIIRTTMPNTLGKLWVSNFCPASLRRDVSRMVEQIRTTAITMMGSVSWFAPSTRRAAAAKLRAMDVEVCWPDPWASPDLPCGLSRTDAIQNLLTLSGYATDKTIERLQAGCRKPYGDGWGKPVYEVNAYYYPAENRFLLPASILRPPFYDPSKSLIWNYGAIGATIGHELCHAFDADGRLYDSKGDKHEWWTPRDDREYRRRTRRVVDLYESRSYRGMKVNGSLTLVENIADLGGLEFALSAAAATTGRPLTKAEKREFFTAYAISWRAKDRLKRAAELLQTDSHAPPALRVNHVVRQFDEWYEAFDITPDSPGYIPPGKRIRFFH
jgi:predicted metalloendopeptidase